MENTGWRKTIRSVIPFAIGLSSLACAAVIAYFLRHEHEHYRGPYIAGLVSAVVAFLSAIYARYREIETDKQTATMIALQTENQVLIEKMSTNLTGGKSFAAIYYPLIGDKRVMTIRHFGEAPLTNIRIAVLTGVPPRALDGFIYPSLPPKAVEKIKPVGFKVEHRLAMQVLFETLNTSWNESIVCSEVDGELLFALNVWRSITTVDGIFTREILFEDVHPRYPRDEHGIIDWSLGSIDISSSTLVTETPEEILIRQLQMRDPFQTQKSPAIPGGTAGPR